MYKTCCGVNVPHDSWILSRKAGSHLLLASHCDRKCIWNNLNVHYDAGIEKKIYSSIAYERPNHFVYTSGRNAMQAKGCEPAFIHSVHICAAGLCVQLHMFVYLCIYCMSAKNRLFSPLPLHILILSVCLSVASLLRSASCTDWAIHVFSK